VLGGFRERAKEVFDLLRGPKVGFVLVAAPEPEAVDEALLFHARLTSSGMPFAAFVINRVRKPGPPPPERQHLADKLAGHAELAGMPPYDLGRAAQALLETDAEFRLLAHGDAREIARVHGAVSGDQPIVEVPFLDHDVHDVRGLTELVRYLIAG
jgi:anion-transporting  ArsA/GET3 family ATPase